MQNMQKNMQNNKQIHMLNIQNMIINMLKNMQANITKICRTNAEYVKQYAKYVKFTKCDNI